MEEALVARLAASAPIAAIVGNRVDWFDRPDGFPALVLTKAAPGREWNMDGPDGLDAPRVQGDCWALAKGTVAALARALRAEMEQPRTVGAICFHEGWLVGETWNAAEDIEGGETAFRVTMDFKFYFEET